MSGIGWILSLPVRIVNAPIRVVEDLCNGCEPTPERDRLLSKPLDLLADKIEEIDK
jgi:hypothetical protein